MQKLMPKQLLFFLYLLCSASLSAQNWKGQVIMVYENGDKNTFPAIINNKNQNKITFAEDDGRFRIKAEIGDTIYIHPIGKFQVSVGYRFSSPAFYTTVPGDTSFVWKGQDSIYLPVSVPEISEEISVPKPISIYTQKLTTNAFSLGNFYNPYQLIQGKIPGVVISRPGGDPNYDYQVQIRGLHSAIYTSFANLPTSNGYNQQFNLDQPLVVVDGAPGWSLNSIDPQDIASIEVLKDAASLAAFGMRGANGVINIQSKKGAIHSRGIEYSTYLAMDMATKPDRGIDAATYRSLIKGTFQGVNRDLGANNDWYKLISRTGFSQAHNLALNGSKQSSSYRLALNFREVNGVAKKSGFDQLNALLNVQKQLQNGRGNISGLFAFNRRSTAEVNPDVFRTAALMNPTAPIFADTPALSGNYYQPNVFGLSNPLSILNWQTFENSYQTLSAGVNAQVELPAKIRGEIHSAFQHNLDTYGWAYSERNYGGYTGFNSWKESKLAHAYFNAQLSRGWNWNQNNLKALVGYSYQRWDGRGVWREGASTSENLISYRPLIDLTEKPDHVDRDTPYRESDVMPAWYAQARYTFKRRWFAQTTWRREGFTRLGANKWANYPSITVGGVLVQRGRLINELRMRAGYGVTGNLPPKNYATKLIVQTNGEPIYSNGEFKPGIFYPFVPNPNLQAEQRRELNLGFDLELLSQRMQLYIDLYKSHSSQLLWQYSTSTTSAAFSNNFFENRMEMSNQGIEIQLHLAAINEPDLTWRSNLSLAHNRTKLESPFPTGQNTDNNTLMAGSPGSPGFCCAMLQLLENQQNIGQFYGYRSEGISNSGQWIIQDLNGDDRVSELNDRTYIGNAQADLTFGWDNHLRWKNLSLNMFWRGAVGHDLMNVFNLFYANPQRLKEISGHSIPQVALSPEFSKLRSSTGYISDYFVQNATFFRLDNLSIAYDFTKNPQKEHNLQIYLSAQNLFTLTSFSGNDPEVRLSNIGAPLLPGIVNPNYGGNVRNLNFLDRGRYPITQTLVVGAKLKL